MLTARQARFVEEYLVDLNGTQAAIRCGYSPRAAQVQASRLLSNAIITEMVNKKMNERSQKVGVTAERVINEIARMAFYDPADIAGFVADNVTDIAKLPEDVRRAIVGWKQGEHGLELKLADKSKALDQLARHLSIYNDKVEVKLTDGLADRVRRAKERSK